jgi:hypothetical protein
MNMTRHELSVGRILGIQIAVDYSWFLIFGLLTWSLAIGYYPAEFKNWSRAEDWIVGAVTSVALFVCVLLHELGHSIVAIRFTIPVKRITLFIFGGVSQIGAESPRPSVEFAVAIAGPQHCKTWWNSMYWPQESALLWSLKTDRVSVFLGHLLHSPGLRRYCLRQCDCLREVRA